MNERLAHVEPTQPEAEALAAIAPHITGIKRRILEEAGEVKEQGLTPDEFQDLYGGIINTVRRRFTDLWKEGHLRPTDRVRPNRRGHNETVWVLGRDPLAKLRRRAPKIEGDVVSTEFVPDMLTPGARVFVTVLLKKEEWEQVPTPARVRFI